MNVLKARIMYGILAVCMVLGLVGIIKGATKSDEPKTEQNVAVLTTVPSATVSIEPTNEIQIYASTNGFVIEATPVVLDSKDLVSEITQVAPTVSATPSVIEGKVSIVADPTYIFSKASSEDEAISSAKPGEAFEWISAYSTDSWAAISYDGGIAFVSMDCVEVDGLADRSEDVFTVGIGGMSVSSPEVEEEVFITPLPTSTPTPTPTPIPTNTPTPLPTNTPAPQKPSHSGATFVPSAGSGGNTPATVSDEVLLTCLIATEAEDYYDERLAVGSVVVNICNNTGKSMFEVISAPNQFEVYAGGQLQRAINNYLSGKKTYSESHRAAVEVLKYGPTVAWTNFWAWSFQQTMPNFQTDGERIGDTWFFDWH